MTTSGGSSMSGQKALSLRAVVRGRVQGVGFRDFVYTRARILGVTGYVRNLSDGLSVEVIAEGQRSELEQLLEYLREGPRMSRVDGIESEWGEATDAYDRFGMAF
jgi:acylphosphatase